MVVAVAAVVVAVVGEGVLVAVVVVAGVVVVGGVAVVEAGEVVVAFVGAVVVAVAAVVAVEAVVAEVVVVGDLAVESPSQVLVIGYQAVAIAGFQQVHRDLADGVGSGQVVGCSNRAAMVDVAGSVTDHNYPGLKVKDRRYTTTTTTAR